MVTAEPVAMPVDSEARTKVEAADATLFYAAFEGCTPEILNDLMLPEYRMIHDQGGLVFDSRADFVGAIKQGCIDRAPGGKNEGYSNRRLVVPGTRTIRRMGNWGVIENGDHVFFELRQRPAKSLGEDDLGGAEWVMVGGASYTHVWQWMGQEGRFRLSESLSYDHGAALPYPPEG
jgi:hypothetical protein